MGRIPQPAPGDREPLLNNWEVTMKRRTFMTGIAALGLATGVWVGGHGPAVADEAPEKIRIGYAVSMSGPYAPGAGTTTIGNYELWLHDVNAAGGIYLKKYDKKV